MKSASISFRVLTVSYASRLGSIFLQLSEDFLLVQAILVEVVDDEPCKPRCVEPAWSEFSGYSNDGQATLEIIDVFREAIHKIIIILIIIIIIMTIIIILIIIIINTNKSVSCRLFVNVSEAFD